MLKLSRIQDAAMLDVCSLVVSVLIDKKGFFLCVVVADAKWSELTMGVVACL